MATTYLTGSDPLRQALSMSGDTVFTFDPDGTCIDVLPDPATPSDDKHSVIGKHVAQVITGDQRQIRLLWAELRSTTRAVEFSSGSTDDQSARARYLFLPVVGADGAIEVVLVNEFADDQSPNRLDAPSEQTVHSEYTKDVRDQILRASHKLKNTIAAITGRAQLLMAHVDEEDVLSSLQVIQKASEECAEIVSTMLELPQEELTVRLSLVDINSLISEVVELTRHLWQGEARIAGRAISLHTKTEGNPVVMGNFRDLKELLCNLVINAYEAISVHGEIRITSVVEGDAVIISVSDDGKGMSSEARTRAFEPFFTTKNPTGTGLGLNIVQRIASRHDGSVHLETESGVGTTMSVTLPIVESDSTIGQASETNRATGTRSMNVLLIDDQPELRESMAEILRLAGHSVVRAGTGKQGIERFKDGQFDIVFTDLSMPGLSGWDVSVEIKRLRPGTPVVLVTGWEVEIEDSERDLGNVDAVLSKPFDMYDLQKLVIDLAK